MSQWPGIRGAAHPVILRISAALEVVTGCALLAIPSRVIDVLIGSASDDLALILARVLGAALVALGIAGWLAHDSGDRGITLAFVVYNAATVAILTAAGLAGSATGFLLWPTVAAHAILGIALLLHGRE